MSERATRRSRPVHVEEQAQKKPGRFAWEPKEPIEDSFDYEGDLAIDLNYLHLECQNHAALFMKYAKESSRSAKVASLAEEKVKTIRSMLVKAANDDPDGTLGKGVKPTAPNVEAYYRNDEEYQAVKANWIDAMYYADLMKNAVFAFQARKSMLEMEVKLHGQQYYSVPEIENLSDAAKEFTKLKENDVERRIKNRMNNKEV
jgi:hypothetical protein